MRLKILIHILKLRQKYDSFEHFSCGYLCQTKRKALERDDRVEEKITRKIRSYVSVVTMRREWLPES